MHSTHSLNMLRPLFGNSFQWKISFLTAKDAFTKVLVDEYVDIKGKHSAAALHQLAAE